MKLFIYFKIILLSSLTFANYAIAKTASERSTLTVISIYQLEDDSKPGFDFFTANKKHQCGGKGSNRYRSYSDHAEVGTRKFQLIMAALNNGHKVSVKTLGCEGRAMLVDYIGISLR